MNETNYWKCEYENLRRKKNKEIEKMILKQSIFARRTYDLLRMLGMSNEEIYEYYKISKSTR